MRGFRDVKPMKDVDDNKTNYNTKKSHWDLPDDSGDEIGNDKKSHWDLPDDSGDEIHSWHNDKDKKKSTSIKESSLDEYLNDRAYLKKRRAEREALRENAIKQDREAFNQRIIDRDNVIASHEAALDRFYNYKDDVKKTLLKEALMKIYEGSFHNITEREHVLCEALLEQYIQDTGTTQLLKNMKFSDSFLLRKIHEEVNDFASEITAGATADDPDSQVIDPTKVDSFWKEIDKSEDIEDITNLIRMRVSNAEEDFINKNQEDKEDVKTVLKQTAARVQAAKGSNDNDYSEAVEESETRLAKDRIYQIQHESHHNVFDRMVRNLSEVALTNEEAKKEFLAENGHLDVEKIVESARCMYTLLEMVGTIQLEKVDQQYIEDTLKSIK